MLQNELIELGLSESEAGVYLAGLELGPASIMELAQKTGSNRTSLYHTMQQLLEKRLFATTSQGKKTIYVAEPPEALKHLLQLKIKHLDNILGDLAALTNTGSIKPVITFYKGFEGIRTVSLQSLATKEKTMYAISGIQSLNNRSKSLLHFWLNEFGPLRKERGIKTKLIVPDTEEGIQYKQTDEATYRETKFVPASSYKFDSEFLIHEDVVDFFVYSEKEEFAVSVKSSAIANTMKEVWQIVWNQAYSLNDKK